MNQLTPADAATLGMTETELAHLCDQYQAAEFYPAITPEERTEAAARVVLTAAGFAESPNIRGGPTSPACIIGTRSTPATRRRTAGARTWSSWAAMPTPCARRATPSPCRPRRASGPGCTPPGKPGY
jgi:hypothetical protein